MKDKLLAYDKDPKSKAREHLLPFSQRHGTVQPPSTTFRIKDEALDALGRELSAEANERERAKAARRYAELTRTTTAPVPA